MKPGSAALPATKRERIVYLLDHWDDIFSPALTTSGGSGGGGVALLPGVSRHHSVVELARCLLLLRLEAPVQHAHLVAFHGAEWRTVKRARLVSHKGKRRPVSSPRPGREEDWVRSRERLVPAWVDRGKVSRAEQRLCELTHGSLRLPEEFEDALTLSIEEIAVKERKRRAKTPAAA